MQQWVLIENIMCVESKKDHTKGWTLYSEKRTVKKRLLL